MQIRAGHTEHEAAVALSQEVTVPTHSDGDLLLYIGGSDNAGGVLADHASWTEEAWATVAQGVNVNTFAATRVASSEPATYTFAFGGSGGGDIAAIVAIDPEGGTPQVDDSDVDFDDTGSSATIASPSVTVESGGMVFVLWVHDGTGTVSVAPSNMTHLASLSAGSARGELYYAEPSAGAFTDSLTWSSADQLGVAAIAVSAPGASGTSVHDEQVEGAEAGDVWTSAILSSQHETWTEGAEVAEGFSTFELFLNDNEGAHGGDEWTAETVRVQVADFYAHEEGSTSGDSWEPHAVSAALLDEGASAGDSLSIPADAATAHGAKRTHIRIGLGI